MKKYYLILLLMCFTVVVKAQLSGSFHLVPSVIRDGDTIPSVELHSYDVVENRTWKDKRKQRKYYRLQKKVVKVYPYAKLAGDKLDYYAEEMDTISDSKRKKKFYKKIEKELKEEYEGELRKLTVSEGRILIKLIDRETGNTSYSLVKELRGKFTAFFWQGLAKIFGHNLKSNYDPKGVDKEIELIVQQIEMGYIPLNK